MLHIILSAAATRSRSPNTAPRRCLTACRSSSRIIPSSQTCHNIWLKAKPLKRWNAYRIFDRLLGQLLCVWQITIRSCEKQPCNCVQSNPEKLREPGNMWPIPSWPSGAPGATLAQSVQVSANWVRKFLASLPDCCASWIITGTSTCSSSTIPSAAGFLLALARPFSRPYNCSSIPEWSQVGGRKRWVLRSAISLCDTIICSGWLHTLGRNCTGSVNSATHSSNSCALPNVSWVFSNPMLSALLFKTSRMGAWSAADTRASQWCCSDPDIAMKQAHLLVPILCVKFGESASWGITTINGTLKDFAVVAAAAGCPTVESALVQ